MIEKNRSTDEDNYTTIKVPNADDTYLESMIGNELEIAGSDQTTCSKCGLAARTKEELQDHISNAHKEAGGQEVH